MGPFNPIYRNIGAVRFELTTTCTPYKCASQLRYAPDMEKIERKV